MSQLGARSHSAFSFILCFPLYSMTLIDTGLMTYSLNQWLCGFSWIISVSFFIASNTLTRCRPTAAQISFLSGCFLLSPLTRPIWETSGTSVSCCTSHGATCEVCFVWYLLKPQWVQFKPTVIDFLSKSNVSMKKTPPCWLVPSLLSRIYQRKTFRSHQETQWGLKAPSAYIRLVNVVRCSWQQPYIKISFYKVSELLRQA